jgi:dolichyl-phosphate beta-glucosyltransferase
MDADGSTPITEIKKLQAELEKNYSLAIGSRKNNSLIEVRQPFYREYLGKTFNLLVRALTGTSIIDTQCGFKLIKGKVAHELFAKMTINGFAFDVELLYLAAKSGFTVAEIPVVWVNDKRSKVSLLRDPLIMLWEIFKIQFIHNK